MYSNSKWKEKHQRFASLAKPTCSCFYFACKCFCFQNIAQCWHCLAIPYQRLLTLSRVHAQRCIIGGNCHKYHFCRDKSFVDKSMLVMTKVLSQIFSVCRDITFVTTYICRDKHNFGRRTCFVATKMILVAAPSSDRDACKCLLNLVHETHVCSCEPVYLIYQRGKCRQHVSVCRFTWYINGENAHISSVMLHDTTSQCVCLAHLPMGKVHTKVAWRHRTTSLCVSVYLIYQWGKCTQK